MKSRSYHFLYNQRILIILIGLFLIASVSTREFLTVNNLLNLLLQIAVDGIIAVGMTYVILTGGIDLSVGSVVAMASVITIWMQTQYGSTIGILTSLAAGAAIGIINGLLVTRVKVSPFVSTLGTMTFVKGIALAVSDSRTMSGIDPAFANLATTQVLGLPLAAFCFLTFAVLAHLFLVKLHIGRGFYAVGGNPDAAWLAGINVNGYQLIAYLLCSVAAAAGGILLTSRINTGSPIIGGDTVTVAVSAVLLGGTSMAGGSGTVAGTLLGILILGMLKNMMNLIGVGGYYQTIILGLLLVCMVLLDRFTVRRRAS